MKSRSTPAGIVVLLGLVLIEPLLAQKSKREVVVEGKAISGWIKELQGKELLPRVRAINALMQAGPEARSASTALLALLGDQEATLLHPLAIVALTRIGPEALPALQHGLTSDNGGIRSGVALVLGRLGPMARPAVPALIKAVTDADTSVRQLAVQALGRIGVEARAAVPTLIKALEDKDAAVRVEAVWALWRSNGETKHLPTLTAALKSENSALVQRTLAILGEMKDKALAAESALEAPLRSSESLIRIQAAEVLYLISRSPRSLQLLQKETQANDKETQRAALAAMGTLGGEQRVVAVLAKSTNATDPELRREAMASLANLRSTTDPDILERGLHDADPGVRWWSAVALTLQGDKLRQREEELLRAWRRPFVHPTESESLRQFVLDVQQPQRAVALLLDVLRIKPIRFKLEAARALSRLGLDLSPALTDLLDALATDDQQLRRQLAESLATLGVESLPRLIRLLGDADPRLREGAALALGRMGVSARRALPALEQILKDPSSAVRVQVALALWSIDQNADQSLAMLNLILKDVDSTDRAEAIEAIGIIGSEARPPIRGIYEILANGLKDREPRVRYQSAKQLWRRERQAKVIVPLLRDGLGERDLAARLLVVELLGELGAEERVVALLLQALEDRDIGVRLQAEESLARLGGDVVPRLLQSLNSDNPRVRLGVIHALELIGPPAKKAAPALERLTGSKEPKEQQAAQHALRELRRVNP